MHSAILFFCSDIRYNVNFVFYLLLIFLVFSVQNIFSQNPTFRHYSVNEGLPNSEVYHVFQDSKGFIWFATNYGVSRFDGNKFTNYDISDGLPDLTQLEIYEDNKGRVWFIPISCKLSYFFNNKIHIYKFNNIIKKTILASTIPVKKSFRIDSFDNVTISTLREGVITISKNGILTKHYTNCQNCQSTYFIEKNNNSVFITRGPSEIECPERYNKILVSENNNKKIYSCKLLSETKYAGLFYSELNNKGDIIFTQGSLTCIINSEKISFFENKNICIFLYKDTKGSIWYGTRKNGVNCYISGNIGKSEDFNLLNDNSVSSVMEDAEGGMWFTTLENGIFYTPSLFFKNYTVNEGLSANKINCAIETENNNIQIATANNILGKISKKNIFNKQITDKKGSTISTLFYNNQNNDLWIGSSHGIYYLRDNQTYSVDFNKKIFTVNTFAAGNNGLIWVGTSYGIVKIKDYKVQYYSFSDNFQKRIHALYESPDSGLWIGSSDGLWKYKQNNYYYFGNEHNLLGNRISDIKPYKDFIILGTKESGIIFYKKNNIFQISMKNGLSSNFITSILIIDNYLWVGTNNGINKIEIFDISKSNYKIDMFNINHGLISNEVNFISASDSMIMVSTNQGLSTFNYHYLKPNDFNPPVYINQFSVFGKPISNKENIILNHDMNFITIEFIGITYKKFYNRKYKYKLSGNKENWNYTQNTKIEYPFLPPGLYKFFVLAQNEDGFWSSKPAEISFTINAPYWEKWWFKLLILLCIILILSIIFSIIQRIRIKEIRKRHILQKNEIEKRNILMQDLYKYRQQALSQQMNPHFIFNTLNSIQLFIYKNDKITSGKYLSMFANLMRITLDNSQHQAIPIAEEIKALELYLKLESFRFNNKFEYDIIINENLDIHNNKIPTLLIQPYVENAIWHGLMNKENDTGKITITLQLSANKISCIIQDNGIGRENAKILKNMKNKTHKSLGTQITENRLKLLNKLYGGEMKVEFTDLYNSDKISCGTTVEILIPCFK